MSVRRTFPGSLSDAPVQSVCVPVTAISTNKTSVSVQKASTVLTVCESSKGLIEPLSKSAAGLAPAVSAAGSAEPSQSAATGSADPSKTANTKVLEKTYIPVRPLARVRMGGVWVDSDEILNPKPPPANNPPKNRTKMGEIWKRL